jgi:hypothetical protein
MKQLGKQGMNNKFDEQAKGLAQSATQRQAPRYPSHREPK